MIYVAKKGEEELEARGLSRRGFLSMLAGGTASLVVPKKSYFFFGNIARPPVQVVPEWAMWAVAGAALPLMMVMIGGFGKGLAKP